MSAIGLLPWPLHQALAYLAGAGCVLAPFALGFTDSAALGVCVGAGVALLLIGLLGRGGPGVAQVLPASVHVGLTYLVAFFLVLSPFVFGFRDEQTPLTLTVLTGLALVVLTLIARTPASKTTGAAPVSDLPPPPPPGPDRADDDRMGPPTTTRVAQPPRADEAAAEDDVGRRAEHAAGGGPDVEDDDLTKRG